MKRFIISLSLCLVCGTLFSQEVDSLVAIKGYYYTVFQKKEIMFSYDNKVRKARGESHQTPIDFTQYSFFIPTQIGNERIDNANLHVSLDSIYFVPGVRTAIYIEKLYGKRVDVSKEICILSECNRTAQFYTLENNDNLLFRSFYIEGYALTKLLRNIEKERFKVDLCIDAINRDANFLRLFFIIKINRYTICIDHYKMKLWQPYLD
jgi:hypothetical protein